MAGIKEMTTTKGRTDLSPPPMYKVIMHNDHYTSMDFVVSVLKEIYHKSDAEAEKLMMMIHKKGGAAVGVYTFDIARTKIELTHKTARQAGFPLRCTMENET
jgi:ATP-dependent Clp protease adaptor protein ClpS